MRFHTPASRLLRILLASALTLAACSRGPDSAVLPEDLQQRVDTGFEEGLFSIRKFERTGSAPFRDAERGVSGVYVYYDTELEFLRDYQLTSWKGLNLGTLTVALGATEAGIEGLRSQGNSKGDVLRVYGRLSYAEADGEWESLDVVVRPPEAVRPPTPTLEGSGPGAVLRSVRELVEREAPSGRFHRDAVVVDELRRAAGRIDLHLARLDGKLTLGTGQVPGAYQDFGAAFAKYASERDLPMHDYQSDGSVRNGFDVHSMALDFAVMQSDVAEILYSGWVQEDQIARPNLRSLASLWPEAVHIVTLEGSGIERLTDLRGKRVAVGTPGSGGRTWQRSARSESPSRSPSSNGASWTRSSPRRPYRRPRSRHWCSVGRTSASSRSTAASWTGSRRSTSPTIRSPCLRRPTPVSWSPTGRSA